MKTTGIVLLIIGILSFAGAVIAAQKGKNIFAGPIAFILVGAYMINRANKNKKEKIEKSKWEDS